MAFNFDFLGETFAQDHLDLQPRMFNNVQLTSFFHIMKKHQENREFCDFTLSTTNGEVECHKLVLSSSSSYFRSLLSNKECVKNIIDVSPLSLEALETVVAFMYNCDYNVNEGTVADLLNISIKWRLTFLIARCYDFMRQNVTIKNACMYYRLASQFENNAILKHMDDFIRGHFEDISESKNITDLTMEDFCEIISNDSIKVKSEDSIFTSAIQLIETHPSSQSVQQCFELIRYEHLSGDFMVDVVLRHPFMKHSPQSDYVSSALKYQYKKGTARPSQPPRKWVMGFPEYVPVINNQVRLGPSGNPIGLHGFIRPTYGVPRYR